jgi:hypothetical protein
MRCRRQVWDSNRVSTANTVRSVHDSRGPRTWRRDTVTSRRSTRISTSFDRELRASSPSQDMTCRKIRYNNRTATTDDHARPPPSSDAAGHRSGWPIRHPHAQHCDLVTQYEDLDLFSPIMAQRQHNQRENAPQRWLDNRPEHDGDHVSRSRPSQTQRGSSSPCHRVFEPDRWTVPRRGCHSAP